MWGIAGVLLGLVLLASLVGFHAGPHTHVLAGVVGTVAAVWLLVMGLTGQSAPVLWLLLGADVALSAGVGTAAYKGLKALHDLPESSQHPLEGSTGTAETELNPEGTVRVRGETWSARSLNGQIPAGSPVQVINVTGIRLEVWGESALGEGSSLFEFGVDDALEKGESVNDNKRAGTS